MREIWQWSLLASVGVAGIFLVIDTAFFVSNTLKIADGGYVPLALAGAVYLIMWIWHRGVRIGHCGKILREHLPRSTSADYGSVRAHRRENQQTGLRLDRRPRSLPGRLRCRPSGGHPDVVPSQERRLYRGGGSQLAQGQLRGSVTAASSPARSATRASRLAIFSLKKFSRCPPRSPAWAPRPERLIGANS
jgi:hypothetical protein